MDIAREWERVRRTVRRRSLHYPMPFIILLVALWELPYANPLELVFTVVMFGVCEHLVGHGEEDMTTITRGGAALQTVEDEGLVPV